jgi:hypothetical protein
LPSILQLLQGSPDHPSMVGLIVERDVLNCHFTCAPDLYGVG